MDKEKQKAFDEKIKRFDKGIWEIIVNIGVSMITTLFVLQKLGLLK